MRKAHGSCATFEISSYSQDVMKNRVVRTCVRAQMRIWEAVAAEMAQSLARPEDCPRAHAAGPDRARVLLVGSGAAMGWGVRSHDLALPGSLARCLAAVTGRGVDVDVLADRTMTPGEVVDAVRAAGAHRFDAVVVTVGFQAAIGLAPTATWEGGIRAMLAGLRSLLAPSVCVVLLGIPVPRLDGVPTWVERLVRGHARALDSITAVAASGAVDAFVSAGVDDADFLEHAAAGYARWAAQVAAALAPILREPVLHREWADLPFEAARQTAVDELLRSSDATSVRVRHLVEMARSALGMDSAVFTVLDNSVQRPVSIAGADLTHIAREHSICQHTIMQPAGMIVEDTLDDPRFRDNPLVATAAVPLRFYAGYPVESPDGFPVGALCVLDGRPRRASEVDTVLLREFALLIQRELWNSSRVLT